VSAAPATGCARTVEARVAEVRDVGAYRLVRLEGEALEAPAPGRFAMARDPAGAAFLPRPVGPFRLDGGGVGVRGDPSFGVGALASARELTLLGPLGRGYDLAGLRPETTLLVAGGIGLTVLVDVPRALGGRLRLLAGFRSAAQAEVVALVDADAEVVLAPDVVTAALERSLAAGGVEAVLAAGSLPMMRAVAAACAAAGVPCQVALEAPMACGFGACYGCAVELDGRLQRLCIEGPVVAAERIA
jgi:dihydroorotate dehydrogenase electron transfer subunit